MQLHVTQREWCDFIIYSYKEEGGVRKDFDPYIKCIHRNKETLETWVTMEKKLERFYREDLAPEIVDPRLCRNMDCKQPNYRQVAINERVKQLSEKNRNWEKESHGL